MASAVRGSKRPRDDDIGSSNGGVIEVGDDDDPNTPSLPDHGTKRLSRNMSEKMRRVRMNNHMMELASIVPSIVNAHKKLDKTSILRLTVNFLRLHSGVLEHAVTARRGRSDLSVFNKLSKVLAEQLNGFLLLIGGDGTILYSSDSIHHYIGINVEDVLGQPVSCILYPEDEDVVWQKLLSSHLADGASSSTGKNTEYRSAEVRLLTNVKGQEPGYTKVKITGPFKPTYIGGNSTPMLIAVVQPLGVENVTTEIPSNFDISTTQYVSKHSLNGQFIDVDARSCLLVGYLQNEMQKLSAYDLIHADDIPFAAKAHLTMLSSNGSEIPTSVLRLKAKNGIWVYSHTSSHLVTDVWTKQPRHLISVNNIVSKAAGEHALEKQRKLLEDLNLDNMRNSENPKAVGQTVLEVAIEILSPPYSDSSSPALRDHSHNDRSPGGEATSGPLYSSDSGQFSPGSSSVVSHSDTSVSSYSPTHSHRTSMGDSLGHLNGNVSTSSVIPLDEDSGDLALSCSDDKGAIMSRSPVNLGTDYYRDFPCVSNSSRSMSPLSDYLSSPDLEPLPVYQDDHCRHSALENRSLGGSSFQTLRPDTSHNTSNPPPTYPLQRTQSPVKKLQPIFPDSQQVDPRDMDKWTFHSSIEEKIQHTVNRQESSIEQLIADASTTNGGNTTQLDSGSGTAEEQCGEQPLLFYLLTCQEGGSTDVGRETEH